MHAVKSHGLFCALAAFLVSLSLALHSAGDLYAQGRTVWDGVYTDAQASRGSAVFSESCSECHVLSSTGEGALAGDKFWEGFSQKSVGDLLAFVKANMPNGNGGSLPDASYNDVVALVLKTNGFPAGAADLSPAAAGTAQIIPRNGPGELPANTLVRIVGCLAPKSGADWTLTNATAPERIEKPGSVPEDATRPLGSRTATLKFVLNRLDSFVGQRMAVTGILLGPGGANGINVSTVNRVGQACP